MFKDSYNFLMRFEGEKVDNSSMNAEQLATSLLALSEAIGLVNKKLNPEGVTTALQVRAFSKGSFIIDFDVVQSFFSQVKSLLAGDGITAYCNGWTIITSIVEVLALKKWLASVRDYTTQKSDDHQTITFTEVNNVTNTFTIYVNSFELYQDYNIQKACTNVVHPLSEDGIHSLSFSDKERITTFVKEDLPALTAAPNEAQISRNVLRITLWIETAAFKEGNKWRFQLATSNSVFVTILDEEFLARVESGEERFGKGDALVADVEFTQVLRGDKTVMEYSLLKVWEHKTKETQPKLFHS